MKILTDKDTKDIFNVLKDETRLAIYICLSIYPSLTVRELSLYLNRGKTTINHHLGKLIEKGVVKWDEKEEDKRKLKTRYFSLNDEVLKRIYAFPPLGLKETKQKDPATIMERWVKTQSSVTANLLEWTIKYFKENLHLLLDKTNSDFFIKRVDLTPEKLQVYQEQEKATMEEIEKLKEGSPITHIGTHILIPIKDILEWKKSLKE